MGKKRSGKRSKQTDSGRDSVSIDINNQGKKDQPQGFQNKQLAWNLLMSILLLANLILLHLILINLRRQANQIHNIELDNQGPYIRINVDELAELIEKFSV